MEVERVTKLEWVTVRDGGGESQEAWVGYSEIDEKL